MEAGFDGVLLTADVVDALRKAVKLPREQIGCVPNHPHGNIKLSDSSSSISVKSAAYKAPPQVRQLFLSFPASHAGATTPDALFGYKAIAPCL